MSKCGRNRIALIDSADELGKGDDMSYPPIFRRLAFAPAAGNWNMHRRLFILLPRQGDLYWSLPSLVPFRHRRMGSTEWDVLCHGIPPWLATLRHSIFYECLRVRG